jgi:DNA gyrase subunit A
MEVLSHGQTLFAATENGFGKRTSIDEYPLQRRGGKGVITIKTTRRNGLVVGILLVDEHDDLMLMADSGKLIRISVAGISVISRNTQGVKLIVMTPGEKVAGVVRLAEKEDDLIGKEDGLADKEDGLPEKEDGLVDKEDGLPEKEDGLVDKKVSE